MVNLFVCLSVCLFVCLFVYWFVCLSVCSFSVCLSVSLFVYLSVYLFVVVYLRYLQLVGFVSIGLLEFPELLSPCSHTVCRRRMRQRSLFSYLFKCLIGSNTGVLQAIFVLEKVLITGTTTREPNSNTIDTELT